MMSNYYLPLLDQILEEGEPEKQIYENSSPEPELLSQRGNIKYYTYGNPSQILYSFSGGPILSRPAPRQYWSARDYRNRLYHITTTNTTGWNLIRTMKQYDSAGWISSLMGMQNLLLDQRLVRVLGHLCKFLYPTLRDARCRQKCNDLIKLLEEVPTRRHLEFTRYVAVQLEVVVPYLDRWQIGCAMMESVKNDALRVSKPVSLAKTELECCLLCSSDFEEENKGLVDGEEDCENRPLPVLPRRLRCGHVLCLQCLGRSIEASFLANWDKCPFCRTEVGVFDEDLEEGLEVLEWAGEFWNGVEG